MRLLSLYEFLKDLHFIFGPVGEVFNSNDYFMALREEYTKYDISVVNY